MNLGQRDKPPFELLRKNFQCPCFSIFQPTQIIVGMSWYLPAVSTCRDNAVDIRVVCLLWRGYHSCWSIFEHQAFIVLSPQTFKGNHFLYD
jgi:hypothetical protein